MLTSIEEEPVEEFFDDVAQSKHFDELLICYFIDVCSILKKEFYDFDLVVFSSVFKEYIRVKVSFVYLLLKTVSLGCYHLD